MIFSVIDFPDPLAPRMTFVWPFASVKLTSFKTTFSSKASCTCSSTTTFALLVEELNQHLRDEEIHRDDSHRSRDDRNRRRPADALRAAARPKSDMAGNRDDHEAEHERLDQSLPDVLDIQRFGDRRPIKRRSHLQLEARDNPPAEDADEV